MLNYIGIKNFKSISNVRLKFSALTLFAGANGSGKSSVIQTLLLLKQSFFSESKVRVVLNGNYTHLGQAKRIEYNWSEEEEEGVNTVLCYEAQQLDEDATKLELKIEYQGDDDNRDVIPVEIDGQSGVSFIDKIHFLGADRVSPSDIFPYSSHEIDSNNLGVRGEFTTGYLSQNKLKPLDINALMHPSSSKYGVSTALISNVQAWMQAISPGVEIIASLEQKINASVLEYKYGGVSDLSSFNVGFGITYVLPVVTRILMSRPGDIVILDNPEAHVHPRGQVELGRLIGIAANAGVQIIVETHSDHLFNGIRLHIKEQQGHGRLDYSMYYVERLPVQGATNGQFVTSFERIELASDAKILSAPPGFFDEWENTIFKLL